MSGRMWLAARLGSLAASGLGSSVVARKRGGCVDFRHSVQSYLSLSAPFIALLTCSVYSRLFNCITLNVTVGLVVLATNSDR